MIAETNFKSWRFGVQNCEQKSADNFFCRTCRRPACLAASTLVHNGRGSVAPNFCPKSGPQWTLERGLYNRNRRKRLALSFGTEKGRTFLAKMCKRAPPVRQFSLPPLAAQSSNETQSRLFAFVAFVTEARPIKASARSKNEQLIKLTRPDCWQQARPNHFCSNH